MWLDSRGLRSHSRAAWLQIPFYLFNSVDPLVHRSLRTLFVSLIHQEREARKRWKSWKKAANRKSSRRLVRLISFSIHFNLFFKEKMSKKKYWSKSTGFEAIIKSILWSSTKIWSKMLKNGPRKWRKMKKRKVEMQKIKENASLHTGFGNHKIVIIMKIFIIYILIINW